MEPKQWDGWDIFRASSSGRIDIVRLLIEEHDEDPNSIDSNGHRPLDYAIADNREDVRSYLEFVGGEAYRSVNYPTVTPVLREKPSEKPNQIVDFLRSFFSFDGRIGRLEYVGRVIFGWVAAVLILFLIGIGSVAIGADENNASFFIGILAALMTGSTIQFASGAKRLHDFDMSGWMQIIPLYNIIVYFMLVFRSASLSNEAPGGFDDFRYGSRSASTFEQILAISLIAIAALIWASSALQSG